MTIGQLANRTGSTVETIRYYESIKLLAKPKTKDSGHRRYTDEYVDRLVFISKAKELGFTLNEIKALIATDDCEDICSLANIKLEETIKKIDYYNELKVRLKKLINSCPNKGSKDKCTIIKTFSNN